MSQEEQNLEAVEKWKNLFNTDLSAMVTDSNNRDCVVHYMGLSTGVAPILSRAAAQRG